MNRAHHQAAHSAAPSRVRRVHASLLGIVLLAGCFLAMAGAEPKDAAAATRLEYQVKAGFIFNFAKFVAWPTNAPSAPAPKTFRIAVLDDATAFNVVSNELTGKLLAGQPIEVVRLQLNQLPGDCQIVFVSRSLAAKTDEVTKQLAGAPALTIGEADGFAAHGGCINFVRRGENIRFEINLEAAERAGLKVSSKLASMATLVKTREVPP